MVVLFGLFNDKADTDLGIEALLIRFRVVAFRVEGDSIRCGDQLTRLHQALIPSVCVGLTLSDERPLTIRVYFESNTYAGRRRSKGGIENVRGNGAQMITPLAWFQFRGARV